MHEDGSVVIKIFGDDSPFKGTLKKLGKATIASVAAAGTALVGLGGFAVKAGSDFESAFAGVRKTVEATEEEFARLEKGIRDMAKEMPTAATEVAGVAEAAGQLGIANDNILEFSKTMVMLGDATNLSADEAATTLARFANVTGMAQGDFDRLGSTIVALGNNMATTESEIAAMGMRIAGAGTQVGMSEAQILSFAAALSSVGIEAEAGGTAFSTLMSKMNLATAKGGEELNQFAKVAGMSSAEFKRAFEEDAGGAIQAFIQGLSDITDSGGSAIKVLDDMGLADIRMRDALLRASGASDLFTEALEIGSEAWEENTALVKEAEQRYATFESQLAILKNRITDLGITVYQDMRGPLVEAVAEVSNYIGELDVVMAAAFADTSDADMVRELRTELLGLGYSAEEAADILGGGMESIVGALGSMTARILTDIAAAAPGFIDAGVNMIGSLLAGINENSDALAESALSIVGSLGSAILTLVPQIFETGASLIASLAESISASAPAMIPVAVEAISKFIQSIAGNLSSIISAGIDIIVALAEGIINALPELIEQVPLIVISLADAINNNAEKLIFAALELIIQLGIGLIKAIPTLIANIPVIIEAIVKALLAFGWLALGGKIIKSLGSGIKGAVGSAKTAATEIGEAIKGKFMELPGKMLQIGKDIVTGIANGIKAGASNAVGAIGKLGGQLIGTLMGKKVFDSHSPSKTMERMLREDVVGGMVLGIKNGTQVAADAMSGLGKALIDEQKAVNRRIEEINKASEKRVAKTKKEIREERLRAEKESLQEHLKAVEGFRKEYEKAMDEAAKAREKMATKLGDMPLFTRNKNDYMIVDVDDLKKGITAIERFDEAMTALKERRTPTDLMQEIIGMDTKEATELATRLINMGEGDFDEYVAAWQKKQALAKEVAEKYYKDQVDAVEKDFTFNLLGQLSEVPDEMENIGRDSVDGIIKGIDQKQGELYKAVQKLALGMLASMQSALSIKSPSGKMADQVGEPSAEGVEVGFMRRMKGAYQTMQNAVIAEVGNISANISVSANRQASQEETRDIRTYYQQSTVERTPNIIFKGDLAPLARILKPYIDYEENRVGSSIIKKGVPALV